MTDRLERLLVAFGDVPALVTTPGSLCAICAETLDVDGAGISLITAGQLHGLLCSTDDTVTELETLQFSLGEGPCGTAFRTAEPVFERDLSAAQLRWPVFAAEALALGVRAVFAFPLGPGLAGVGALTLYRNQVSDLSEDQLGDALVLADLLAEIILTIKLDGPVDLLSERLRSTGESRSRIHQATGMVSVQLGVPAGDALSRLRAEAWTQHRSVAEVAADIVARRLRLDPDGPDGTTV